MKFVDRRPSPSSPREASSKFLTARGHGVFAIASGDAVHDLEADWFLLDGRHGLDGAIELALRASRDGHVAVMTNQGLRCARTWRLLPSDPHRCADFLEASVTPREAPVLVVEDDDDTRRSVVDVLRAEGLDVIEARDGHEALRRVTDGPPPCLVLLDVMMPNLDGLGVLRVLSAQRDLASIPVILATCLDEVRLPRRVPAS